MLSLLLVVELLQQHTQLDGQLPVKPSPPSLQTDILVKELACLISLFLRMAIFLSTVPDVLQCLLSPLQPVLLFPLSLAELQLLALLRQSSSDC